MELSNEAIWKSLKVAGFNQGLARMDNGGIGMEMTSVPCYFTLIALSRLIEVGAVQLSIVDGLYPNDVSKAITTLKKVQEGAIDSYDIYKDIIASLTFIEGEIEPDEPDGNIATL